jgi:hypothetical protein
MISMTYEFTECSLWEAIFRMCSVQNNYVRGDMTTDEAVAWCVARGAVVHFHWYYHNPCVEVHVSGRLPITCSTFVEAVEAQQRLEPRLVESA